MPMPATDALTADELKEYIALKEETRQIVEANAELKRKLSEEKSERRKDLHDETLSVQKAKAIEERIRQIEGPTSPAIALHDELQQLRLQCAAYAASIEDTRLYYIEMCRLRGELETATTPATARQTELMSQAWIKTKLTAR